MPLSTIFQLYRGGQFYDVNVYIIKGKLVGYGV